jgi:probable phosphoglycerate mutase
MELNTNVGRPAAPCCLSPLPECRVSASKFERQLVCTRVGAISSGRRRARTDPEEPDPHQALTAPGNGIVPLLHRSIKRHRQVDFGHRRSDVNAGAGERRCSRRAGIGYLGPMITTARWPRELILVRHGESAGNVARDAAEAGGEQWIEIADRDMDVALSSRGVEQAQALGHWLTKQEQAPAVTIASPYERAAQTARIALESSDLDVPLVLDERLREREFGILDRLTKRGIVERFPEQAEARSRVGKFYYRPPNGESWCDVALRVRSALDSISREFVDETVLVVAHEVVILMFRYVLEHLSEAEVLSIGSETQLLNCSVSRYIPDPSESFGMRLHAYNEAVALAIDQAPITREPVVPRGPR